MGLSGLSGTERQTASYLPAGEVTPHDFSATVAATFPGGFPGPSWYFRFAVIAVIKECTFSICVLVYYACLNYKNHGWKHFLHFWLRLGLVQ